MAKEDYIDLDEDNIDELEDRGDTFEPDEDEELEEQDEDQDEEEEEVEDEDESVDEEEEEEPVKKEPRIPKSRLDEVIAQREDARERNLWLEAQLEKLINQSQQQIQAKEIAPEPSYNFEKAEEDYVTLIIEGEIGKATKLRAEIDAERQKEFKRLIKEIKENSAEESKKASSAIIEQERFDALIENYENKYKFLDSESKDYNEEAVDTVNTLLAGYVAAGKTKAEGLKLAVQKVAPLYEKTVETKTSLGNKRKVEAGKKAAKASVSQPSKTKSSSATSIDTTSVNISKLSERDFNKLTDIEKRRLRGDF